MGGVGECVGGVSGGSFGLNHHTSGFQGHSDGNRTSQKDAMLSLAKGKRTGGGRRQRMQREGERERGAGMN